MAIDNGANTVTLDSLPDRRPMVGECGKQRQQRRFRSTAAIGLLLVIACLVGVTAFLWQYESATQVLVTTRSLGWSHRIQPEDLTTTRVLDAKPAAAIPVEDRARVEGMTVDTPIPAGTVLNSSMVESRHFPLNGAVVVGIPTKPWQRPGRVLRPGSYVCVAPLPDPQPCPENAGAAGRAFLAPVIDTKRVDDHGTVVVDLEVERDPARVRQALTAATGSALVTEIGP